LEGDDCQEHLFALQTALELDDHDLLKIMARDRHVQETSVLLNLKPAIRMCSAQKRQQALRRHHLEQRPELTLTKMPGLGWTCWQSSGFSPKSV
jgi:hypothetical protein